MLRLVQFITEDNIPKLCIKTSIITREIYSIEIISGIEKIQWGTLWPRRKFFLTEIVQKPQLGEKNFRKKVEQESGRKISIGIFCYFLDFLMFLRRGLRYEWSQIQLTTLINKIKKSGQFSVTADEKLCLCESKALFVFPKTPTKKQFLKTGKKQPFE